MIQVYFEGLVIGLGLLVAIGPQNAYVLRQGIRGNHVFAIATTCALSDIALIALGVMGVGKFVADSFILSSILGWGGAAFLLWFGYSCIRSAINPKVLDQSMIDGSAGDAAGGGQRKAILHAMAFTWLNPHVYLDTLVMIGGVSIKYDSDEARLMYFCGAITASIIWFYGLGYSAKKAAPLFKVKRTWRILDSVIAVVMILIASALIHHQLQQL